MRHLLILLLALSCRSLVAQDILKELQKEKKSAPTGGQKGSAGSADPGKAAKGSAEKGPLAGQPAEKQEQAPAGSGTKAGQQDGQDGLDGESESSAESDSFLTWLDGVGKSGPLGMLRKGGLFMWPILILGILAAGVIIERYRSLRMLDTDTSELRESVSRLLHEDRVEEALHLCDRGQGPVPPVLACGLRKYMLLTRLNYDPARTQQQVIEAMEDNSVHIVAALERHLPILATISSVAPMLGFLGTVSGMITSFDDIRAMFEGAGGGGQNIVLAAASGISVALITTCFGLIIGIPAFMAYNYFTGIINRFVLEVEESTTELIEGVTLQLALAGTSTQGGVGEREKRAGAAGGS